MLEGSWRMEGRKVSWITYSYRRSQVKLTSDLRGSERAEYLHIRTSLNTAPDDASH